MPDNPLIIASNPFGYAEYDGVDYAKSDAGDPVALTEVVRPSVIAADFTLPQDLRDLLSAVLEMKLSESSRVEVDYPAIIVGGGMDGITFRESSAETIFNTIPTGTEVGRITEVDAGTVGRTITDVDVLALLVGLLRTVDGGVCCFGVWMMYDSKTSSAIISRNTGLSLTLTFEEAPVVPTTSYRPARARPSGFRPVWYRPRSI